jgi:hypothetical protein
VEIIAFTVVGIGLYFFSDWALNMLEKVHGQPLPQRNIIFFVLIMTLALSSFSIIRTLMGASQGPQYDNQEQQATDSGDQPSQTH